MMLNAGATVSAAPGAFIVLVGIARSLVIAGITHSAVIRDSRGLTS